MKNHHFLRTLFCFLLCLSMVLQPLAVIPVQAADSENLFQNGTFADSDGDGKAEGWSYYIGSNTECTSRLDEDGITITSASGQRLTVHQTKYGLTAGETYHLSFRYRISSYTSGNLQLRYLVGSNSADNKFSTTYVIAQVQSVTDGWITVDKDITLPADTNYIKVEFAVNPSSVLTCSIDDVSLTEGSQAFSAPTGTSLLLNSTFADADSDSKADSWNYYSTTTNPEAESSLSEDGITIAATADKRLTVHQTAAVETDKTYLLMFRYKVTALSKGYMEVRYNAGTGSNVSLFRSLAVTDGWQTVTKEITPIGTSLKLEFAVGPNADMTVSVDDVYLVPVADEPEVPEIPAPSEPLDTLLKNGTFLDADDNGEADEWTYWKGDVAAASTSFGTDGLTITAASTTAAPQRLSVNQTVTGLDASKSYRFTGEYNVTSKSYGSLTIGYYANGTGSRINKVEITSTTGGVQTFEQIITGVTSAKLEAAVSQGANMTCTINNFRLEEIPSYTVTFDANDGTGTMKSVSTAGEYTLPECTFTAPDENHFFKGWEVNGEVKAAGETITVTANTSVKAVWGDNNLILNPTYSNTDIASIPSWNYYPAYDTNVGTNYNASVADGVFTGTVLGDSNLILHQIVQTNDQILNKTYRFTADIKTEDITGYAMFKIYLQNGSNQLHSYSSAQYKGDTEWTTVTIDFDLPATVCGQAVTDIKLEQYILKGTGTASFRNVSIRPTGDLEVLTEGDPVNSLVSNGGYEYTLSGAPAMWQVWESTGGLKVESDRKVLCPSIENNYSSLHLSNVTAGSDSRGSVHQTFKITEDLQQLRGQSVKIGQWVKTENFVGDTLALRVHYATVSGSYISKAIPVASTQDWTYYEYIIDLPNTNFQTLKIENLYDYAQGDVWIDNTVVTGYIKAKGLTLDADKVYLAVGGTQELTVTYAPANTTIQKVTWTSSDPSVATVENGTITGVAPGCATITVTHVDGMEKQIAVLVGNYNSEGTLDLAISTTQNTAKSDALPVGYDYQVAAEPQYGTFLVEGGVYTYYPAKDFAGSDSVTLLVTGDAGQFLAVVPLTVTAVNTAPEFGKMTIITNVGEAVTGALNATDAENDELTYSVVTQPENGSVEVVTVDGIACYTFTPKEGFSGYDAVTFQVSDGEKTATKEVTVYVAPATSALLATVKTAHSRLLADDARFEELKKLIESDENAKAWFAQIKATVDPLLSADSKPVPYDCPDGVRLNTQGSKDVLNLAFMYRMTGEEAYLNRAKLELLYLCGLTKETYIDWHPSHLLDTAMTANGVAIAYDWLYGKLTAEEKAQVELAIYQNALVEAEKQFEAGHMFVTNGENWNYICNGGFITAALALAHNENVDYNTKAGEILQRCYASIQYGLPQYAPEGASIEGISYWDYGTRYLVSLLASISSATTNNPFLNAPGLDITAEYPIYMTGKAGSYNYSDNDMVVAYGYLNMWLAHTYGNSSWNWYHKYYMEMDADKDGIKDNPATIYDLLYYYPDEYRGDAPANLDKFYTNQAVTTMRHDFTDPESSFLGFKGGLNGAPHGDVDIGSFIYDIYGYRWAEDFGKDDYNLTGYWEIAPGGTRWNYYRKNAMGHNTLVFNPTKGANQTVGAYAGAIEQSINNAGGGYTILDMTDAYQDEAVSVKRGFAYFDRTQVLIRDEFTLKAPGTAYWQMHTKASVAISEDGKTATLTQGGKTLLLKLVGENADDLCFESMAATTYEGVEYEGKKSNEGYTKVYVKAENVQKAVFNVLITPVGMETPEVKTLAQWSEYDFSKLNEMDCDHSDLTDGVCPNCGVFFAKIETYSISLNGDIAINFYARIDETVLTDENAYALITMADGETIKTPIHDVVWDEAAGYYRFTARVAAKEMTDQVQAKIVFTGGESEMIEKSVKNYADYILEKSTDDYLKELVRAMLHYGAAAQQHFGYNTTVLANKDLTAPDYSDLTITGYELGAVQGTETAKFYSASLILNSETTLRFFFDGAITSATCNGQDLEIKQRGGQYYVDVKNISAKDLDENVAISITDANNQTANVKFNPMAYCQGVWHDSSDTFAPAMKNLAAALYKYNQAANNYFK